MGRTEDGSSVGGGAGRRVQARKVRAGGFTDEKRQIVLDTLAGCANLTRSAKAAGISVETVNSHRRRDPAFARQIEEAIECGYAALEALAIEQAAHGGRGYVPGDTPVPGPGTIDMEVALHLLRLRRGPMGKRTGDGGPRPQRASEKELKEAILAKLDLLAARLRKKGKGGGAAAGKGDPSGGNGR